MVSQRLSGPARPRRRWPLRSVAVMIVVTGLAAVTGSHRASAAPVARKDSLPHLGEQPPGYILVGADGGVFNFGSASYAGSMAGQHLAAPVSAVAGSVDGNGYWLAGEDKSVFALGDAGFHGSGAEVSYPCFGPPLTACAVPTTGPLDPSPAVGIARTLDGDGYLVAMADGHVYGYGDAPWDVGGGQVPTSLAAPIVGVAMSADDAGYWLAGADGGIFARGQAPFFGSLGGKHLAAPITGIAANPDGSGYWLVGADGGVFAFGGAPFLGSLPALGVKPTARVVGMASTSDGRGYWLVGADGGVFAFGDATYLGGMAGTPLDAPVVGIAATTGDPTPQCADTDLLATTDQSSYSEGQPVTITLTYLNPTAVTCSANIGSTTAGCSDAFVYQSSGTPLVGAQVWDAHATPQGEGSPCPTGLYEAPIPAHSFVAVQYVWHQVQCTDNLAVSPPCPQSQVPPGNYIVWGSWGFDYDGSNAVSVEITS